MSTERLSIWCVPPLLCSRLLTAVVQQRKACETIALNECSREVYKLASFHCPTQSQTKHINNFNHISTPLSYTTNSETHPYLENLNISTMCIRYIFTDDCACGKELWRDTRDRPCDKADGVMGACGSTEEVCSSTTLEFSECAEARRKREAEDDDEEEEDK